MKHKTGITLFLLAGVICFLLLARFVLMVFFPGTPETMRIFEIVLPYWYPFDLITGTLVAPLSTLYYWLSPYLDTELQTFLPKMEASRFMAHYAADPEMVLKTKYPGKIEWLTLLAVPFWMVMLMSFYFLSLILSRHQQLAFESWSRGIHMPRFSNRGEKKTQSNIPESSQIIKNRLKKPQSPLSEKKIILPGTQNPQQQESWESFRQREGDLGIKQVIQDLARENTKLRQMNTTFSQYFSPNVMKYMEANKSAFQNMGNQKHQLSILFCDIRNFSAVSQKYSPEKLSDYLGFYFNIALDIILNQHEGVINKLMGDGIMAYWGFPLPTKDHSLKATMAAIDILKEIDFQNRTAQLEYPLEVGIGIATGEVLVGNVGSQDYKDFTLIGTPVNLASRLDVANKDLGTRLLLSEETYTRVNGQIACHDRGDIQIRGWEEPIRVFEPRF